VIRHHVTYVCTAARGKGDLLEEVDDISLYRHGGTGETDMIYAAEERCSDKSDKMRCDWAQLSGNEGRKVRHSGCEMSS
jgi:hypothetical protein